MLKSNANEIFYRVQIMKAQQEAKMADEERQKHLDDAARMKRRANTADIVRKKLSRENAAMKEELDALRKFKAASLAINASRAFAAERKCNHEKLIEPTCVKILVKTHVYPGKRY